MQSWASETRSPEGDSKRIFSMRFLRVAVLREIAQDEVVARLALQNLGQRVAADRGLNGILHIGDVDLVASGLLAVHRQVEVGLAENAKDSEVLDSLDTCA